TPATLDILVKRAVTMGFNDEAIQVVREYFQIPLHPNVLSVTFSSGLGVPFSVTPKVGGLATVLLGPLALRSSVTIRVALETAFADNPPGATAPTPITGMSRAEAAKAAADNALVLQDERSVRAVQGLLEAQVTGVFSADTSIRIADFQAQHN